MKDKKVDAGFFGSFNFTLTHYKLGIVPLARPVWLNGKSTYAGYIFTREDSGISADIKDWRGKTLALVHPYTTAGYFFPRWYLFERGIDNLDAYFKDVIFTGSHDTAVLAVFNQEAEIGAAKNHIFNKMIKDNPEMKKALRILAESKTVPSNGLAVRKDIPESIQDKLKRELLNMDKDPAGKIVLKKFGALKFIETTNQDYDPVREMIAPLNIDLNTFEPAKARHKYLGEINAN